MSTTTSKLHVKVTEIKETATLYLTGHFAFHAHRDFKAAYQSKLNEDHISNLVIDFSKVEYLDSSALGMLLVLRDHVIAANKTLVLARPSSITAQTFDIAGFYKMFTIS